MSSVKKKTAQDIQDDIFQKMSPQKKLRLASDFSMHILRLNKLGSNYYGLRKSYRQDRRHS